jgi:hypothetical protein
LKDIVGGKLVEDDQKTPTRAVSLIQAWLFIGSIQFITRIAVDTNLYIRLNDKGKRVVPTHALLEHIHKWQQLNFPHARWKMPRACYCGRQII